MRALCDGAEGCNDHETDGQFVITPAETGKTVDIAATEKP